MLNQAVKRNLERFPADFMFQLSAEEFENLRSQLVISKPGAKMGLRRAPIRDAVPGAALEKRVDYTQAVLHLPVLHVFGI